jgi:membrane-associated phospholipid phosphatase
MVHTVWTAERIALAYFVYLGIVCWVRPIGIARRLRVSSVAVVGGVAVWRIASAPLGLRLWAPLAYILVGYYASAYLFVAPSVALERWLLAWDRRLLHDPSTRFAGWPRPVLAALEIIYMGCFILIGAGLIVMVANGHAACADHYWTLVVGAELGSFAPLAFFQTRPPWALERKPVLADRVVHELADRMIRHFTIHVNTFPSGHVAGSLAVALAVMAAMPWTGGLLLVLAAAIAVATVVGRYHYVVDAVAGAALTLAIWAALRAFAR